MRREKTERKPNKVSMAEEIKRKITSLADPYSSLPGHISDDSQILELGILDSPAVLELLCWYEEHFSIKLEDDEITIKNLGTVAKMVDFVLKKRAYYNDKKS